MLRATRDALRAILATDATVSPESRAALLERLEDVPQEKQPAVRLLRRKEVAELLGTSTRTVDSLASTGALRRIKLPGRKLASGFRSDDVQRLMNGAAA
jgi:hypothetical protein